MFYNSKIYCENLKKIKSAKQHVYICDKKRLTEKNKKKSYNFLNIFSNIDYSFKKIEFILILHSDKFNFLK